MSRKEGAAAPFMRCVAPLGLLFNGHWLSADTLRMPGRQAWRFSVWSFCAVLAATSDCVVDNPSYLVEGRPDTDGSMVGDSSNGGQPGTTKDNDASTLDAVAGNAGNIGNGGTGGGTVVTPPLPDASANPMDVMPLGCVANCPPIRIPASVADCLYLKAPNPDQCEVDTGTGESTVDLVDNGNGFEAATFLRFDLTPSALMAPRNRITIEMTTTEHPFAAAPQSGAIWLVTAFTRNELFKAAPTKIGSKAVAPDRGVVQGSQTVVWELPTNSLGGNTVYFGVFTTNSDGVNYWNARGKKPPVLVIE